MPNPPEQNPSTSDSAAERFRQQLADQGLNMLAVFDLAAVPAELLQALAVDGSSERSEFRQLLLVGHGGRQLWQKMKTDPAIWTQRDPIDTFSRQQITQALQRLQPDARYRFLYPGTLAVSLIRFGQLAGWQHSSRLRIGINAEWGTWFAYRALLLTSTQLPSSAPAAAAPDLCADCVQRPCIQQCPAQAVQRDQPDVIYLRGEPRANEQSRPTADALFERCLDYRLLADSPCQQQCLARLACPVQSQQRYSAEQIAYHYGLSHQTLLAYRQRSSAATSD